MFTAFLKICAQILDLRSIVCKEGCKTAAVIAFTLRQHALPLAEYFLPALLKQVVVKIQVMSSSADKSLRILVASLSASCGIHCPEGKLLPLLIEACSNKAAAVRKMAAEYAALGCALAKTDSIEK